MTKLFTFKYLTVGALGSISVLTGTAILYCQLHTLNLAQIAALLPEMRIDMEYQEDGIQHMFLNGEDVTGAIRENVCP